MERPLNQITNEKSWTFWERLCNGLARHKDILRASKQVEPHRKQPPLCKRDSVSQLGDLTISGLNHSVVRAQGCDVVCLSKLSWLC